MQEPYTIDLPWLASDIETDAAILSTQDANRIDLGYVICPVNEEGMCEQVQIVGLGKVNDGRGEKYGGGDKWIVLLHRGFAGEQKAQPAGEWRIINAPTMG